MCFYFPPFEHCKFSAEQREGLAHELSDLGGVGGAFSHTHTRTRAHTHTRVCLAVSLTALDADVAPAAVAGLEVCRDRSERLSGSDLHVCVGDFSCEGLTQELARGIQEKPSCH